ncbi:hypothetical protein ACLKA6_018649 [Drosophila palustris]
MDETWIHHYIPESNRSSAEWREAGESRSKRVKASRWAARRILCQVVENREDWMIPIGANYVDHDASGTSGTSSRECRRRLHWLRQRSHRAPAHKRSSSTLTPPTDTPKRVRAAGPVATQKPVATPVRAAQKFATVAGRQEAQDESPSTSAAAAARLSTSSAPTEPRASYASVAKKVKVAVLPVDYP